MGQKRVSFKVAKAIKEVGYPQVYNSPCYVTEDCIKEYDRDYDGDMPIIGEREYTEGQYIDRFSYRDEECDPPRCYAPTYLDVWLWLWREKNIQFAVNGICDCHKRTMYVGCDCCTLQLGGITTEESNDPEEAVIKAIEYLVDNNLIK